MGSGIVVVPQQSNGIGEKTEVQQVTGVWKGFNASVTQTAEGGPSSVRAREESEYIPS